MKKTFSIILFSALCVGAAHVSLAQQEGGSAPPPSVSSSGSDATAGALDLMGVKKYQLGPGDILDLRVFNETQFSDRLQVTDEGNVEVPFIGPIPAKCRTDVEVKRDIETALKKFIKNPQISLRLTEARSRPPATVFGAVRGATRVDMRRSVRLLDVLAVSGGVTEQAGGDIQIFHTEPVMCTERDEAGVPLPRTAEQSIVGVFDVYQLTDLKVGKAEANPVIRPGDIIIVREAPPVYLTGSVVSPQGIYLREKLQLTRAIAMVGGLTKGAKTSEVKIWRLKPNSMEQEVVKVDFEAIRKQKADDIFLQPYDVVEVPQQGGFKTNMLNFLMSTGLNSVAGGVTALPMRVLY